jgi:hypothetical protein
MWARPRLHASPAQNLLCNLINNVVHTSSPQRSSTSAVPASSEVFRSSAVPASSQVFRSTVFVSTGSPSGPAPLSLPAESASSRLFSRACPSPGPVPPPFPSATTSSLPFRPCHSPLPCWTAPSCWVVVWRIVGEGYEGWSRRGRCGLEGVGAVRVCIGAGVSVWSRACGVSVSP